MKIPSYLNLLAAAGILALPWFFSSCSTQPSAPSAESSDMPWNTPSQPLAGRTFYTEGGTVENVATAGLRSGDYSTTRNSIDSILNNQERSRPGLGTGWGSEVSSNIGYSSFKRTSSKPKSVASIYYNDKEGVAAMISSWRYTGSGMQRAASGLVEWGVKSGWGSLKNYNSGSRRYVVGRKGRSYSLVIKNLCHSRLEVVLSVDGLDVMDGKSASFGKRGYIIQPGKTLTVKGFRTSESAVAAFKFSSMSTSYSKLRHGTTRNVGVIGMAVFTEKGVDPWKWSRSAVQQRHGATPFSEAPNARAR